jgi:DNA-directed RNA polymerase subunit RPC12/RpoP
MSFTFIFKGLHRYKGEEDWSRDVHTCHSCGIGFTAKNLLLAHQERGCSRANKNHSMKSERRERSTSKSVVKEGQQLGGSGNFCDICDKQYSRQESLKMHKKTVHSKMKEYKCPTCGREFGHKPHLQRHILDVHEHIRPFTCEMCGLQFSRAGQLKQHTACAHLGLKPHSCDQCEYDTSHVGDLKKHKMRFHGEGEPSILCPYCPSKFALKADTNKHVKKVHSEVTFTLLIDILIRIFFIHMRTVGMYTSRSRYLTVSIG